MSRVMVFKKTSVFGMYQFFFFFFLWLCGFIENQRGNLLGSAMEAKHRALRAPHTDFLTGGEKNPNIFRLDFVTSLLAFTTVALVPQICIKTFLKYYLF